MKQILKYIIVTAFLCPIFLACKKDKPITDEKARISFSSDSVLFDTVFSTVGSVTKRLKIYNPNKGTIKISKIILAGGKSSNFRINVDGIPGNAKDVEIKSKDSLYIFVEVTVDPNNGNNPFVINDSLLFFVNGSTQKIILQAWGQDAIYITPTSHIKGIPPYSVIPDNTVWDDTKPVLIYGYAVVDSAQNLTIKPGTQIYFHKNGGLWVYPYGKLAVNGTKAKPVVFQGDRLEYTYHDIPGQWDRIWINEGNTNTVINYAVIKNAFIGIQAEPLPFGQNSNSINSNKVILKNTVIENCTGFGVYGRNANIDAYNTIVANCGNYGIGLIGGGSYNFYQSTFANYWSGKTRSNPNIFLQNYYVGANNAQYVSNMTAKFYNCINIGNNENEFDIDDKFGGNLQFLFDHCIIKTNKSTSGSSYVDCIVNPTGNLFEDINKNDYHLSTNSKAIDKGDISIVNSLMPELQYDLDGIDRSSDGKPDIGAYEFQ